MAHETKNAKVAQLYTSVPPADVARLQSFRRRYPYQTSTIQGISWPYIDAGKGEPALLLLAGGTGIAELSFQTFEHLAQHRRVIAPDYPPVRKMAALFAGYSELLARLEIGQFYLMGGSYGGWMAQSFVRRYPVRIHKVVVSAAGPPDPENSRQIARLLPLLRSMPSFVLRAFLNRAFSRLMPEEGDTPQQALTRALLKEIMDHRVGRADFFASMERLVDQTENELFAPGDLSAWPGRILLLFGGDDPSTPPARRQAMQRLYPQAEVVVFEGADHTFALSHQHAYWEAIDAFLAGRGTNDCGGKGGKDGILT